MTSARKLRLILIRDSICFVALTVYFFVLGDFALLAVILISATTMRIVGKQLKGSDTKLEPRHRKVYFAATCFFILTWLGLLLSWIIRHSSPPAWAMGSLGIIVLLTLLYASYDSVCGRNAKV
jgi:membrane protein CcdC involved in cytochrome C biogenesis